MAMELAPMEVAVGPMATEFAPVAVLSARVELAWKYLMPAPFASAFSTLTELLVLDRPVDSELTPLWALLMPVEAEVESEVVKLAFVLMPDEADVESEETLLLVVDRPVEDEVDREMTALLVVERPVESEPTAL
jgi:hypothetical protein